MLGKKKLVVAAILSVVGLSLSQTQIADAAGVTGKIEVFSWWTSGSENAALQTILASLHKSNPSLNIINEAVAGGAGTNAKQVLATRLAAGNTPDTWQTHPGGDLQGYINQHATTDLTSFYAANGWTKVMPKALIASVTSGGKIWSVLTGVHRGNVWWTNKADLAKAGVTFGASTTWPQMLAAAKKLQAVGITPFCLGDNGIWAAQHVVENILVGELGATEYNNLAQGKASWNDPKVTQALNDFATFLTMTNKDHQALQWTDAVADLASGSCAINTMGDWAYGELLVKQKKVDGVDFGYTVLGDPNTFVTVSDSFVIGSHSQNPAAAKAFLRAIMSPAVQIAFSKAKGSSPVRTDVSTKTLGKYQQMTAKVLAHGVSVASLTQGQQLVPPAVGQAYADATTIFEGNQDATAFEKSMDTATGK